MGYSSSFLVGAVWEYTGRRGNYRHDATNLGPDPAIGGYYRATVPKGAKQIGFIWADVHKGELVLEKVYTKLPSLKLDAVL